VWGKFQVSPSRSFGSFLLQTPAARAPPRAMASFSVQQELLQTMQQLRVVMPAGAPFFFFFAAAAACAA
jgi:hypothetical protein